MRSVSNANRKVHNQLVELSSSSSSSVISNHEEADTMLILHAIYASENHQTVHIMSPDTDVLILDLRTLPQLGPHTCVINRIGAKSSLPARVWRLSGLCQPSTSLLVRTDD